MADSKVKGVGANHPLRKVWQRYSSGCLVEDSFYWKHLGGKGLTICTAWKDFKNFYTWAIAIGWKKGYSFRIKEGIIEINPHSVTLLKKGKKKGKSLGHEIAEALKDPKKPKGKTKSNDPFVSALNFIMEKDFRENDQEVIRSCVFREATRLGWEK